MKKLSDRKAVITLTVGLLSAIFVLVLTLNFLAAFVVLVMSILSLIFRNSYSLGWLILLGAFLVFPSVKVSDQGTLLSDLLLTALAIIGLINLATSHFRYPENSLFYEFFLLSLIGFSFLSYGYLINDQTNFDLWRITITFLLMWITLVSFQYYFQTLRRIKRFFKIIFAVGLIHAVFGLVMLSGNWQTPSGMGISNGKTYNQVFGDVAHRVNGFLGLGLEQRMKSNPLSPLLMLSTLSGVGFLIVERKKRAKGLVEEDDFWNESLQTNQVQTVSQTQPSDNSEITEETKPQGLLQAAKHYKKVFYDDYSKKELLIIFGIIIEIVALIFTRSEASIIFLAIALLMFGILDRNRRMIIFSAGLIVIFALILPSLISSKALNTTEYFKHWFAGLSAILPNWLLGVSWKSTTSVSAAVNDTIRNNYLYIWNNFGLIGLGIFVSMLWKYFNDIYQGYRRSDGVKRVWLMVILACFISLVLEALTGNTLIYGPAALLFWLLYGTAMNLRRKPVLHGITETKLLDQ